MYLVCTDMAPCPYMRRIIVVPHIIKGLSMSLCATNGSNQIKSTMALCLISDHVVVPRCCQLSWQWRLLHATAGVPGRTKSCQFHRRYFSRRHCHFRSGHPSLMSVNAHLSEGGWDARPHFPPEILLLNHLPPPSPPQ